MITMSEAKLTVQIKNQKPVELTDFTSSFQSLATQYNSFLSEHNEFKLTKDAKLYIKEIRSGCIITELTDLLPVVIPFVEYSNSIIEFTKFLHQAYNFFLGKTAEKPKDFTIKDCNNLDNIITPIAKDNGSSMVFSGNIENQNITVNYVFDSVEANAIQNGISREKALLNEPLSNTQMNQLFYWDSAKYDSASKQIDKGFIDSVSGNSLKVIFADENIKSKMIDIDDNPFHKSFLVDVEVMTKQNIPIVYKIIRLNEILDK